MKKVYLITATKNRHRQLERVVRFALNQTYTNWVHLIYNNSVSPLRLNENLPKDKFILVNNNLSLTTKQPYTNLGEIYTDALTHIPADADVINFMDDDDVFLPNHIEEGIKGLERGRKKAYKPSHSWFKNGAGCTLVSNVLEPSIFVDANHVKEYGFSAETTAQHLQWLHPLIGREEIFVDPNGTPTYICDWSHEIPTFKTSGDPYNPDNFTNYSNWSKDTGDGIITPCSDSWAEHYYKTNK